MSQGCFQCYRGGFGLVDHLMTKEEVRVEREKTLAALAKPGLSGLERYRLNSILYGLRVYEKCLKEVETMKGKPWTVEQEKQLKALVEAKNSAEAMQY